MAQGPSRLPLGSPSVSNWGSWTSKGSRFAAERCIYRKSHSLCKKCPPGCLVRHMWDPWWLQVPLWPPFCATRWAKVATRSSRCWEVVKGLRHGRARRREGRLHLKVCLRLSLFRSARPATSDEVRRIKRAAPMPPTPHRALWGTYRKIRKFQIFGIFRHF